MKVQSNLTPREKEKEEAPKTSARGSGGRERKWAAQAGKWAVGPIFILSFLPLGNHRRGRFWAVGRRGKGDETGHNTISSFSFV